MGDEREAARAADHAKQDAGEKPIERVRLRPRRAKAAANHRYFTEALVSKLKPKSRQYLVWDAWEFGEERKRGDDPARGLAILVSPRGAKSYRAVFYFPGSAKPNYKHLGRVGEITLEEARRRCVEARRLARAGIDPRAEDPARSDTFESTFRDWVTREQQGKRKNKSALATQSFVLANCAVLCPRPVATIRFSEIEALLDKIRDGDGDKRKPRAAAANRLYSHLRDFFGWAARRDGPIKVSPIAGMTPPGPPTVRNRVYSDAELKAIWAAAGALDPSEGAYVKLVALLALRREEVAGAKWSEFDNDTTPTLLTIPFERTKGKSNRPKKVVYRVPLTPLSQRILAGLPRRDDDALFGRIYFDRLKEKLVKHGAPSDFMLHTFRHSIATWLENRGKTEFERSLVLNHSSSTVTSGYSHGHATDLKRSLLAEWAGYIEELVGGGEGVAVLR
jgi:integrase